MTHKDKDLLLKDICARLPYRTKCKYYDCCEGEYDEGEICGFERQEYIQINGVCIHIEEVKPYLFPMSSMTEEQINLWRDAGVDDLFRCIDVNYPKTEEFLALAHSKSVEWLNKNHFDYRGLIEKGLALDATNLGIYETI